MRLAAPSRLSLGRSGRWCALIGVLGVALVLALAPAAFASHGDRGGRGIGHYVQRNLVSDVPGEAQLIDPSFVNAWGLGFGPMTPAWIANNGIDDSTLYSGGSVTSTPWRRSR